MPRKAAVLLKQEKGAAAGRASRDKPELEYRRSEISGFEDNDMLMDPETGEVIERRGFDEKKDKGRRASIGVDRFESGEVRDQAGAAKNLRKIALKLEELQQKKQAQLADAEGVLGANHVKKILIADYFLMELLAPPANEWRGADGAISKIAAHFPWVSPGHRDYVRHILVDVAACMQNGSEYTGKNSSEVRGKPEKKIPLDSVWAQLIADDMENGLGLQATWVHVNQLLAKKKKNDEGELTADDAAALPIVFGKLAILSCIKDLDPVVDSPERIKQGNYTAGSDWAKARDRLALQLRICFTGDGITPFVPTLEYLKENNYLDDDAEAIPACFDPEELIKYPIHHTAFFDETHRKVHIGFSGGKKMRFRRDEEGRLDTKGELQQAAKWMGVKFPAECRLCLGVMKNEAGEGIRLKFLSYSEQTVVGMEKWNTGVKEEIKRARKSGTGRAYPASIWYPESPKPGEVFLDFPLDCLTNCGPELRKTLDSVCGWKTVGDLKIGVAGGEFPVVSGVGEKTWNEWKAAADSAENFPESRAATNYLKAGNPYEARAKGKGSADWERLINSASKLKELKPIHLLVQEMVLAIREQVPDVETPVFLFHDALSQMSSKLCREKIAPFMRAQNCVLILPQNDLNVKFATWANMFPGNQPEVMPLDTHLNADFWAAVLRHIVATQHLDRADLRLFSQATPKGLESAARRVWEGDETGGCPTSKRIVQDINRVVKLTFEKINSHNGEVFADGRAAQTGARKQSLSEATEEDPSTVDRRGGKREAQALDKELWYHKDAVAVMNDVVVIASKRAKHEHSTQESSVDTEME